MELSCGCGNECNFIEQTVVEFFVDGEGNREEKIVENTEYLCGECQQFAEISGD